MSKAFNILSGVAIAGGLAIAGRTAYDNHVRSEQPAPAATAPAPEVTVRVPCALPGQQPGICTAQVSPGYFADLQRRYGADTVVEVPQAARER